jgi:ribonuclease Z
MDHASGIPYIISNKALTKQEGAEFFMPDTMIAPMDQIMNIWADLEGHDYKWNFRNSSEEKDFIINPSWFVRSFPTFHRVKSNGYCLFSRKTKLKKEYVGLKSEDLMEIKNKGQSIDENIDKAFLAVTGDTKIEFLEENPYLYEVDYLVVESTYASNVKSIESCREWGHIHFDEILSNLEKFKGKNIILKHFSRRHHFKEVIKIMDEKVKDKNLRDKLLVLPF